MDELQILESDLKALLQRREHLQRTLQDIERSIEQHEDEFVQSSAMLVDRKSRDAFRLFSNHKRYQ